jgi:hypothetical protein
VVSNLDTGEPLWFGQDRKQETLDEFFGTQLSATQRKRVQVPRSATRQQSHRWSAPRKSCLSKETRRWWRHRRRAASLRKKEAYTARTRRDYVATSESDGSPGPRVVLPSGLADG